MTNKEKQLLLKDLCGRLFTGVILKQYNCINNYVNDCGDTIDISLSEMIIPIFERGFLSFRLYLRPMSSMTEEEKEELKDICTMYDCDMGSDYECFGIKIFNTSRYGTAFESDYAAIDWLNAHHFDYRGLIEKGLAIEAPKDMYKTE